MADKKISALTSATTPLAGTEVLPIVQSGSTVKVAISDVTAGRTVSAGSLTLTDTGSRITGDMTTGTQTNRLLAQTSTANQSTTWGVVPNGSSQVSQFTAHNASDPTNASRMIAGVNSVNSYLTSSITGTGTYLPIYVSVNNAVQCQFETTGDVKLNTGNLVIGTAAKGINFTANTPTTGSTSQLLNWYEEGTYTGTLTPGTSGTITVNSSINKLSFTRIGRIMYVTGLLRASSVSAPVGTVIQLNLPTTIASGNYYTRCGGAIFGTVAGTIAVLPWQADEGTSFITIYVTASTFIAGDDFRVDMFYITA